MESSYCDEAHLDLAVKSRLEYFHIVEILRRDREGNIDDNGTPDENNKEYIGFYII